MATTNISETLLRLVADDRFAAVEALATRPSLFRIVGRTHTETWHSMFLGWLLDPKGSHQLREYPLRRLLVSIVSADVPGTPFDRDLLARTAAIGDLEGALVVPNERQQQEKQTPVGRLDCFVSDIRTGGQSDQRLVILVEQKVDARIRAHQCRKYADWLDNHYARDIRVPLLLIPADRVDVDSETTCGDARWTVIDYQILHDQVLVPCLSHPGLNPQTRPLIEQYLEALRTPANGRKLAVTEEERQLAQELYDSHQAAFEAIAAALADTTEITLSPPPSSTLPPLSVTIDGKRLGGKSVGDLFGSVLQYLVDSGKLEKAHLPYATSNQRFLLAQSPHHPNGKAFRTPVEYGGFYMEAHKSRERARIDLSRFLKQIGVQADFTR